MSKARIVNAPKLELFTVARGRDSGEKTLGVFLTIEDAWDCLKSDICTEWIYDIQKNNVNICSLLKIIKENMTIFSDCVENDGEQTYLYNGSGYLPRDIQDKFSSIWWWVTKHYVDIPDNMIVR